MKTPFDTKSAAANDLFLIVVNDGNGDQCGMTYEQRCKAMTKTGADPIHDFRLACKRANNWRVNHDCKIASHGDMMAAASAILAYYRNHVAEMAVQS